MLRVRLCLCLESVDVEQIAVEAVINSNGVFHCDSVPEGESDCYQKQIEDNWCQNTVEESGRNCQSISVQKQLLAVSSSEKYPKVTFGANFNITFNCHGTSLIIISSKLIAETDRAGFRTRVLIVIVPMNIMLPFLLSARCYAENDISTASRLSVRLSVCP